MAAQTFEPIPEQIQIATSPNRPAKHTGHPAQKAARSNASCYYCFHPSYSELTAFLIIHFLISARLPDNRGVTYAIPPYKSHL